MPSSTAYLQTGQHRCYDDRGREIPCPGSGQDGEYQSGRSWPVPRFREAGEELIEDRATGLVWCRNGSLHEFPLNWSEALEAVAAMNREQAFGRNDWRLPNRRELRSLIDHSRRQPALSEGHPFEGVVQSWYWTATTAAIHRRYAWYLHFEGGRLFYGNKTDYYCVWPVCGNSAVLPQTGQQECFGLQGEPLACTDTGQDGEYRAGTAWPPDRFAQHPNGVLDRLSDLIWYPRPGLDLEPMNWSAALEAIDNCRSREGLEWRLPSINELESLVDASCHSPALPREHPFPSWHEAYWSSTTSGFETDWAYALYLHKGAVGVGFKPTGLFSVWPVRRRDGAL